MLAARKVVVLIGFCCCAAMAGCDNGSDNEGTDVVAGEGVAAGEIQEISFDELKAALDASEDMVLIDVRTATDWSAGHIQNAINIPLEAVVDKNGALVDGGKALTDAVPDKTKKIVAYCFGYGNDLTFAEAALDLGYGNVFRYEWGTAEWVDSKHEFLVVEYDGFKAWYDAAFPFDTGKDYLVDVLPVAWYTGEDAAHPGGHIPGAVNIPIELFANQDGTLVDGGKALTDVATSKDGTLVIYCGNMACGKSLVGVKKAVELGYTKVFRYQGGWQEWQDEGNALKPGAEP